MAVSIDNVYQKVLAFANKEQRGYITPQEFNLFAHQAQMEIFEQYFYDINQWSRQHGNSTAYGDILDNIKDKIKFFEKYNEDVAVSGNNGNVMTSTIDRLYRITMIRVSYQGLGGDKVAEEIQLDELNAYADSSLSMYSKSRPIYIRYNGSINPQAIRVYPYPSDDGGIDQVNISYTQTPTSPIWGYVVVNDKALYNSTASQDFELHASEESELVYRILAYAGIAIEKPQLTQAAVGLETTKVQQEKQ